MKNSVSFLVIVALFLVLSNESNAQLRSNKLGVGVSGSYFRLLTTQWQNQQLSYGGGLDLTYSVMQYVGVRVSMGYGSLHGGRTSVPKDTIYTNLFSAAVGVSLDIMPASKVNPFIIVGAKMQYFDPHYKKDSKSALDGPATRNDMFIFGGAGVDFFLSEFISITLSGNYTLLTSSNIDGVNKIGTVKQPNDAYAQVSLGVKYYFFDEAFMKRMLRALESRSEK